MWLNSMASNKICWSIVLVYSVWSGVSSPVLCFPRNSYKIISGEFKSLRQVGDQIEAQYERLNPDGSISKSIAYGNPKEGLEYENYEIDPLGNVLDLDSAQTYDRLDDKNDYYQPEILPKYAKTRGKYPLQQRQPKPKTTKMKNSLNSFFRNLFDW